MNLPRLKIRNIKVSVFLSEDLKSFHPQISEYQDYVFTIYPYSKRLINVTKLKSVDQLKNISNVIKVRYNVSVVKVKIDSIMLSRKVKGKMFSFQKTLLRISNQDFKIDNDRELFHAPWVKSKYGSFNLFSCGSVTCMGVKCLEDIKMIEIFLDKIYCKENVIKEFT